MNGFMRSIVASVLSVLALLAFAGIGIYYSVLAIRGQGLGGPGDVLTYLWNGIGALVGGFVAASFGLKLKGDDDPQNGTAVQRSIRSLGVTATTEKVSQKSRAVIGGSYLAVYVVVGLVATVAWAVAQGNTPEIVRTLATTFIGLALPIVSTFLQPAQN